MSEQRAPGSPRDRRDKPRWEDLPISSEHWLDDLEEDIEELGRLIDEADRLLQLRRELRFP
jgi:hypothetical protein